MSRRDTDRFKKDIVDTAKSVADLREGETRTIYFPGKGLYLVHKRNNKLYYIKYSEEQ
jgi:hypothetical protein